MRDTLGTASLSLAFVLTGIGVALLGAALPAMLVQWHLNDRSGGSLLFSAFAGTMCGALVVHRSFRGIAALGLAVAAAATLLLSLAHQGPLRPAFFLYGLGLGATMTSISLLRSREVPAGRSGLEMNRLNLLWAAGACCAPTLALHSLRLVSVSTLFRSEAVALALTAVAVAVASGRRRPDMAPLSTPAAPVSASFAPLRLCLAAAAAVGLESAIGGWLTTYTERMAHGAGFAVSANSFFWFGLLLSRAAHSFRIGHRLHSRWGVGIHLACVITGVLALVLAPVEAVLPLAALLSGFGLGPLYPLTLAFALPRYRSTAVFVSAGLGASLLPWLTGVVSTSFHSLRAGLAAPVTTLVVLLASAVWMRREFSPAAAVSA